MNEKLLNSILKGTKESATRKEINESSLLFEKLKCELINNNNILSSIEKALNIKPDDPQDKILIYLDIDSIEVLLNPNYIHQKEKKIISKRQEKNLKKFNEGLIPRTTNDILRNLLHHLNIQVEALKLISKETELSLNYPYPKLVKFRPKKEKLNYVNNGDLIPDFQCEEFNDDYCGACMESPCQCSDPEKTSTTYWR